MSSEWTYSAPNYSYAKSIYGTGEKESNVSSDGSSTALGNDVAAISGYIDIMLTGDSYLSKKRNSKGESLPLGGKYFMKSALSCKDIDTGKIKPRMIYINNVPTGSIAGSAPTKMKGLIPGIIQNVFSINPSTMLADMKNSNEPPCVKVGLEVIDHTNELNKKSEEYVAVSDLIDLRNKYKTTMSNGEEAFTLDQLKEWVKKSKLDPKQIERFSNLNDSSFQSTGLMLYCTGIIILFSYILYRCMKK